MGAYGDRYETDKEGGKMSQKKIKNDQLLLVQKMQEFLAGILNAYIDCPQEVKDAIEGTELGLILEDRYQKIQTWKEAQISPVLDPSGQPVNKGKMGKLKVVN
jgi:hypothetical protein